MVVPKNQSIDGLRGYLALAVVIHHFWIEWAYMLTGQWVSPSNTVFKNLGPSAVIMFFMITGFLFYGKLIRSMGATDWSQLYLGRVLRLAPMYWFCVALLLLVVLAHSGFALRVDPTTLLKTTLQWVFFTMLVEPDINNHPGTSLIMAGVTWTLRYEWVFYLILPTIAFVLSIFRPPVWGRIAFLGLAAVILALMPAHLWFGFNTRLAIPFIAGMIAYDVGDFISSRIDPNSGLVSLSVTIAIVSAIVLPLEIYSPLQMLLLSVAFILISNGNAIFGFLFTRANAALGEATYSIYLLQGFVLYAAFQAMLAMSVDLASRAVWLALPTVIAVLVAISLHTYRWIEKPFIDLGRRPSRQLADAAP